MSMRRLSVVLMAIAVLAAPVTLWAGGGQEAATDQVENLAVSVEGQGFSWDMASGTNIKVLLNQHPYAEAVIKKIDEFEQKTGIKVDYSITPEENYFDKVTTSLNSRSGDPDVFMTGAYQIWEYAMPDYIEPLEQYIENSDLTSADYHVEDFYEGIIGALQWDKVPGHPVGKGSQWALPMGFEQYTLAYNKRIFAEKNLQPPTTIEELETLCEVLNEFDGKGSYALALRGTRNWATIHPGYMTTYVNFGAKDLAIENGRLVSKVNSPEAVDMTQTWVDMIKTGGSPSWSSYTWYQAGADFGAGKAAMLFDADVVEYFQNPAGASEEAGNIAWVPAPLPEGRVDRGSNLWTWALAMNSASKKKMASWIFLQYFTGAEYQKWSAVEANTVNPPRRSVFDSAEFQRVIENADGYKETFEQTIDGTTIQFTPQPYFFELTTEWASTLQDLVTGKEPSVQAGMDKLKNRMDKALADVELK
jgi:multiple sugar transport system substrate-binding protein